MQTTAIKTARLEAHQLTLLELIDQYVPELAENSILAITSKVVSLCEGRVIPLDQITKDDLVPQEADFYLQPQAGSAFDFHLTMKNGILLPSAGVDESNSGPYYVLWPEDPQASANQIRAHLSQKFQLQNVGVIITDSKTNPLRWGVTGVGLAGSGFRLLNDYRNQEDLFGRPLVVTQVNVLDALAATAVFEMGESNEALPLVVLSDFRPGQVHFTGADPEIAEIMAMEVSPDIDIYSQLLNGVEWHPGQGGAKI